MDCLDCPRRPYCREICPEIEKQLPSLEAGKVEAPEAQTAKEKITMINSLFAREEQLTPRQRCLLYLFYRTSLPTSVVAEGLRITENTIYSTIRRIQTKVGRAVTKSPHIQRDCNRPNTKAGRRAA